MTSLPCRQPSTALGTLAARAPPALENEAVTGGGAMHHPQHGRATVLGARDPHLRLTESLGTPGVLASATIATDQWTEGSAGDDRAHRRHVERFGVTAPAPWAPAPDEIRRSSRRQHDRHPCAQGTLEAQVMHSVLSTR